MTESPGDGLELLFDGPADAAVTVALAHGAGVGMDAPFMQAFAAGLATAGLRAARFEFPYMAQRRKTGNRRPPDRADVLCRTWHDVIAQLACKPLVIAGKSMGGRVASLIADEAQVAGLVCLGYPFHPPGKPERTRVEHLQHIKTPTLIVQGTRDPFGTSAEVPDYPLSRQVRVHWLEDGEHSFKPRKSSGRTKEQNWQEGVAAMVEFIEKLVQRERQ